MGDNEIKTLTKNKSYPAEEVDTQAKAGTDPANCQLELLHSLMEELKDKRTSPRDEDTALSNSSNTAQGSPLQPDSPF